MENIGLMIFVGALMLLFPSFAFYRGICHGKARRSQLRRDRILPALKHTALYAGVFAIIFTLVDSQAPDFEPKQVSWWSFFLGNTLDDFVGLSILCGLPFTVGILLLPRRSESK